jgi:hypothetical protein
MPGAKQCPGEPLSMTFAEFSNFDADPLVWYDFLVRRLEITGLPAAASVNAAASAILAARQQPAHHDLDLLAALLLNRQAEGAVDWFSLFSAVSACMAGQLQPDGDRPLRMRCQRLAYCIQLRCSRTAPFPQAEEFPLVVDEQILPGTKAWDVRFVGDDLWWVTSDHENVHRRRPDGRIESWRLGLPTQLDVLADGRIIAGSLYSDGCHIRAADASWTHVPHNRPVVTAWERKDGLCLLDADGGLWFAGTGERLALAGIRQVHFARKYGHRLFVMDNSDVGGITIVDLHTLATSRVDLDPVMICNDVLVRGDAVYAIDKQQGLVFKFDKDFVHRQRALSFGPGPGQLLDPVALTLNGGNIAILSWINSKITIIQPF